MANTLPKWNEEREATLVSIVNGESPVQAATVKAAAEQLETSERSVASKLRRMGVEVAKKEAAKPSFTEQQTAQLQTIVETNPGEYSAAEVAEQLGGGITPMQVRGKLLSLDLSSTLKAADKTVVPRKYTPEQETRIVEMVQAGAFLEDIATEMGKEVNSIRGKCLSLLREHEGLVIPKSNAVAAEAVDVYAEFDLEAMDVASIAEAVNKTERAVKGYLTTHGIKAVDYDGAKKRAKLDSKK